MLRRRSLDQAHGGASDGRGVPDRGDRVARLGLAALVAVLAIAALTNLVYGALITAFKWDVLNGETLNVFFADRLIHHGELYQHWQVGNLVFPIYQPGFYWLSAPLVGWTGVELWPGRLLSLIAMLFAAFAAYRIAARLGCGRAEASASALAVLAVDIGVLAAARPDSVALAFGAASLLAITAWEDSRRPRTLILGAVAAVGMIVVKYNFAPLAAAPLVAVLLRDRRAAVMFGGAVAVGSVLLFSIAQVASSGLFLDNMRDFSGVGYSWTGLREVLIDALLPFPYPVLAIAAVEAAVGLFAWRAVRSATLFWFASLAVLATAIKAGSALNYWLAVFFASAVLLGPAVHRLRLAGGPSVTSAMAAAVAMMLLPFTIDHAVYVARTPDRLSARQDANSEAVARIKALGGRLLEDRPDLAIESGHHPSFDPFSFSILAANGKWNPDALSSALRKQRFGAVQSRFDLRSDPIPTYQGVPRWPVAIVQAARSAYCLSWKSPPNTPEQIWIYRPCRPPRATHR